MEGWNDISVLPVAGAPSMPVVTDASGSLVPMGMGWSIAGVAHRSEGVTTKPSGLG